MDKKLAKQCKDFDERCKATFTEICDNTELNAEQKMAAGSHLQKLMDDQNRVVNEFTYARIKFENAMRQLSRSLDVAQRHYIGQRMDF